MSSWLRWLRDIDDAILYAAGANSQHGLQRINEDKRKSVKMLLDNPKWKDMSSRQIADAVGVSPTTVTKKRDAQVSKVAPESDKGGAVIGKDGKSYPVEAKKKKEAAIPPAKVERGVLDVLKDMSKLYLELPRKPNDAVVEMSEGGECLSSERAEHMAWWFTTYAKIVKDYTEEGGHRDRRP